MEELLKRLKDFAREHNLLPRGSRIGVAVSGGPDSVFLLTLLNALKDELNLNLTVLHFNHKLREEADREEQFVVKLVKTMNLEILTDQDNVKEFAKAKKLSIEHAARIKRYIFFEKAKFQLNLDFIATGHTMNDFVETFLINLLRGSTIDGLVSLKPKRNYFIRPIMVFKKEEILDFIRKNNIEFAIDKSNMDKRFTRNKVRLDLLKKLQEFNPNIVETLFRSGMTMLEDVEYLKRKAETNCARSTKFTQSKAIVDLTNFDGSKSILGRSLSLIIKRLLESDYSLSFKNIKRVEETVKTGKTVHLRGKIKARRLNNRLIIEKYDS